MRMLLDDGGHYQTSRITANASVAVLIGLG
jgi:hypothetical protein